MDLQKHEPRSIDDTSGYLQFEIPMVSSDGESHAILTGIAVGSGLLCAIVVMLVLVTAIDCRRQQRITERRAKQQRSKSMFSLFAKRQSLDITIVDPKYLERVAGGIGGGTSSGNGGAEGAATVTKCEIVDETVPAAWRTKVPPMGIDETIFDASGKLHGIATVSC